MISPLVWECVENDSRRRFYRAGPGVTTNVACERTSLVHLAPVSDQEDGNASHRLVNPVDDSPVTHPESEPSGEIAAEPLDVVVTVWFVLELREASGELARQRRFR